MTPAENIKLVVIAVFFGALGAWLGGLVFAPIWSLDWTTAESASVISTALGAIGTVATLVFLIFQNSKIRIEQKEQTKLIAFQRYQGHKDSFNELLRKLSKEKNVTFRDADKLYDEIFPDNNFERCSLSVESGSKSKIHKIRCGLDALTGDRKLDSSIGLGILNINSHLFCQKLLMRELSVVFNISNDIGNVYFKSQKEDSGKLLLVNVFGIPRYQNDLHDIVSALLRFTGVQSVEQKTNPIAMEKNRVSLLDFLASSNLEQSQILFNLDQNIQILFLIYGALYKHREHNTSRVRELFKEVDNLFLSRSEGLKLVTSKEKIKELYCRFNCLVLEILHDDHPKDLYMVINEFSQAE